MKPPLLSRRQLQDALERLAHHLHRRGVHAELYLFGGGAMVLAHHARDATMDLDTAIRQHHGRYGRIAGRGRRARPPVVVAQLAGDVLPAD